MEDTASHPRAVFVTAQIDLTGARGGLLGGRGPSKTASGELPSPAPGLVLWRVIERIAVEKQLESREVLPATDGQSVSYSYTVKGGGGGLFPSDGATMTATLFLSESALQMTTDAIAIAGKAGYLRENGLERLHRDALGIVIAAPINGQVLGSIGESLRQADRSSHLYKV